jgi:hypothetical protein
MMPRLLSGSKIDSHRMYLVLLRDIKIGSNEYPLGDLISHCIEVFDIDFEDEDEGSRILHARLGIEALDDQERKQAQLRKQVELFYVEGRSLALRGLRSGLSLGGKVSTRIIMVPSYAVADLVLLIKIRIILYSHLLP